MIKVTEMTYHHAVKSTLKKRISDRCKGEIKIRTDTYNALIQCKLGEKVFSYPVYGFGLALKKVAIDDAYIDRLVDNFINAYMDVIMSKYFK